MSRVAWLVLAAFTAAQASDRGELSGLVQDATGGALVAASVTVMDQDTGLRQTGRTDGEGAYRIPGLPAGEYKVTVRKPGFQTVIRWNVRLERGQDARLDFAMRVGSVRQTIEIHGGTPLINTNDGSVGTLIGRDAVESLPLNGRGLLGLVDLAPGVLATPAAQGEAGQFSANGLRANTNYFTVDGVSANTGLTGAGLPAQFAGAALPAMTAFGSTENLASRDALDEVHVLTSSFAPQFGRLPGAQVNVTTRSGSDRYHGSAWYALRNEALGANDAFAQGSGLGRAAARLNQWAATVGGPLLRNRTFFFASYEGLRLDQPYTLPLVVPSLGARAEAPPAVQPALDAFPLPTRTLAGGLLGERVAQFSRPARLDAASLRVDHALTGHVALFGRYNWAPSFTASGFSDIEDFRLRTSSLTIGIDATPSPAIANDARINLWNTRATSTWTPNPETGGTPLSFGAMLPAGSGIVPTFYGLAIGGVGSLFAGAAAESRQGQLNLVDTLTVTQGVHTIRVGVDYQRLIPTRANPSESVTAWWPSMTAILANGIPTIATTSADEAAALVETLSVFAQDAWRATSGLTVTYGLRWEISPPPATREPAAATAPVQTAPIAPILPVAPLSQPLWQTNYAQVAPRIGAAFRLDDRSAVRAGFGIFYDTGFSTALDPINGFPFNRWQFSFGGAAPPTAPGFGLRTAPGLQLPYAEEWNLSWERMFGLRNIATISYVGSAGHRLLRYEGIPQPGMDAVQVAAATNDGRSHYQALELQFRRRLAPHLEGTAAYTWSHGIDNGSYDSGVYLAAAELPAGADTGASSFDVRHNFNAGLTCANFHSWQFSGMLRARTGFPIDVLTTENFLGLAFDDITRPNLVPGVALWLPGAVLGARRLNPAAFSQPSGIEGSLGRNAIAGFGMWQADLAVERKAPIGEHAELRLRLEAYNAFNHPNAGDPVRFLDSPFFGTSISMLNLMLGAGTSRSGLAPAFQPGGPRSLQLSVGLRF